MRDYGVPLTVIIMFLLLTLMILSRIHGHVQSIDEKLTVKALSLPEQCAPYYNDGTGLWAECMGVGPK